MDSRIIDRFCGSSLSCFRLGAEMQISPIAKLSLLTKLFNVIPYSSTLLSLFAAAQKVTKNAAAFSQRRIKSFYGCFVHA
jgi:hypothetical protein